MENIKNMGNINKSALLKEYQNNLQDKTFKDLVSKLKIDEKTGSFNNSQLWDSTTELKNCENCSGLFECKNRVMGHFLYPNCTQNIIDLIYVPCKYKKENAKMLSSRNTASKELKNARFKEIDVTDKKRVKLIKWLKNFYDAYDGIKSLKGLYLHGSFGSGKTYLIYALLNELKINKKVEYEALYFPEILRILKDDWNTYSEKIEY